jgi:heme O synthase-like polyprenyltransferase
MIMLRLATALRLGRVSNLPTVWSNVLAGVALSGSELGSTSLPLLLVAFSLLYVAGMYLNDAFDVGFDRRLRPERPIPAGVISRSAVFAAGFAMLVLGLAALAGAGGGSWPPLAAGLALALMIVIYDAWHKENPAAPVLMGICRLLVYVAAAAATAPVIPGLVWIAGAVSFCYVNGLTYAAKQEYATRRPALWPFALVAAPFIWGVAAAVPNPWVLAPLALLSLVVAYAFALLRRGGSQIGRAVAALIAGISLVDAIYLLTVGSALGALLCLGAFAATLAMQRTIPGT